MNTIVFEAVEFSYPEGPKVIEDWTVLVPAGITSLIGRNGTGKSTFLLLASARLLPQKGRVLLAGKDTNLLSEDEKNKLASVVYQNLEFENEEPLGELLEFVHQSSPAKDSKIGWMTELVEVFELGSVLKRSMQTLSKGEHQRAVMAFSLLWGSQIVVMDEPVFALEDGQKNRVLNYIADYAKASGRSFLYSAHELELSQRYSENLLLFSPGHAPRIGPTAELFNRQVLEEIYQTPWSLIKQHESLVREHLNQPRNV